MDRHEEWDSELLEDLREKQRSPQYQEMQAFRKKLPSWNKRKELIQLIENNQIIVISGETGQLTHSIVKLNKILKLQLTVILHFNIGSLPLINRHFYFISIVVISRLFCSCQLGCNLP